MTNPDIPTDNSEQVALLPCLYDATLEQIERANAAVDANLINGVPRWGSAQGYACALTAIMQSDARPLSMTGEGWQPIDESTPRRVPIMVCSDKDLDDYSVETMLISDNWADEKHRFFNLNSGNYSRPDWWTHWQPLPEPPAAIQEQGE